MIFAPMSTRWVRKFGNKAVVATGLFVLAVALVLMATFQTDSRAYLGDRDHRAERVRHGPRRRAGDRVDHGLAPPRQGRRRLGDERHHPPGGRRGRRRVARIDPGVRVPSARCATSCTAASRVRCSPRRKTRWGARWASPGTSRRRRPFAARIVDAAQTSFVNGMHAAVLVAAAIAVDRRDRCARLAAGARPAASRRRRRDRACRGGRDRRRAHCERDTSWRVMVMRWISLVPSPMHRSGASR